jgi:hypothetical protein
MSKLRLKETAAERQQRKAKEEQRAARKRQKRGPDLHFDYGNDVEDRQWILSEPVIYRTPQDAGMSYDLRENGSVPLSSGGNKRRYPQKQDNYEQIKRELEEANFRAKLFDAMDDDDRLDSIQARFNAYHVPDRWQESEPSTSTTNPNHMDEDEYVEWIRRGMWERRHKQEVEEQQRQEKEKEDRKSEARKHERERRRMEDEIRQRHREHKARRLKDAYDAYLSSWSLLAAKSLSKGYLSLGDIPWPMSPPPTTTSDITSDLISSFLFADLSSAEKPRKQRIREALLIYHPDRFEKWASLISDERERALAREAAGAVSRSLNSLAEQ